jgi:hypothetical protein
MTLNKSDKATIRRATAGFTNVSSLPAPYHNSPTAANLNLGGFLQGAFQFLDMNHLRWRPNLVVAVNLLTDMIYMFGNAVTPLQPFGIKDLWPLHCPIHTRYTAVTFPTPGWKPPETLLQLEQWICREKAKYTPVHQSASTFAAAATADKSATVED